MGSCFVKCIGCAWECPSLYDNQMGYVIPDEKKRQREAMESIYRKVEIKQLRESLLLMRFMKQTEDRKD